MENGSIKNKGILTFVQQMPEGFDYEACVTGSWDMDIYDFKELCKRLALAAGYHPDNVNEVFGKE
jgi:hypothetical protein